MNRAMTKFFDTHAHDYNTRDDQKISHSFF